MCPPVCPRKLRSRPAWIATLYQPDRLFHGVWLPQWLEERPEVSEKAKKLYAYLTYFAGGKGYSWPSFGLLGEKLHCSRRHVMRLVQELSAHRLITGDICVTPLVTPVSPKENNKKRTNCRGKLPATSSITSASKASSAASPPPKTLSDTTKIILERRITELRTEIIAASKRDNHLKADQLHSELTAHQVALGFTPDDPPPKPKAPRKDESDEPTTSSNWPSPEEVTRTFDEVRRSLRIEAKLDQVLENFDNL